jgi:glutamine amidotransferase
MGWNEIRICREHPLVAGLTAEARFYFVHSYHVVAKEAEAVLAETEYGVTIHSILSRGNIVGAQFHPEKSHKFGLQLLKNFAERVS